MGEVLEYLGDTRLELGPAAAPGKGDWRLGFDEEGIAWLALDQADGGVNTISENVIRELDERLDQVAEANPAALVIRSAKPGGFAAGADIGSFGEMAETGAAEMLRQGHRVLDRLEAFSFPTIAVVHGAALGAGFELALACKFRIAVEGARFAFPEVRLGLHPGLGGSFRLTELIDPIEAMTMMLTGRTAHTEKARNLGIVDVVTRERHVAAAVRQMAKGEVEEHEPGLKSAAFRMRAARAIAARQMRARADEQAKSNHYPAPHALIRLWEEHGGDRGAMQKAEIESFARLLETETSRNLIRVFFLRQGLKAAAGAEDDIAHVHVVGAGAMGAGIAAWAAIKGKTVTLGDIDPESLGRAVRAARGICRDNHLGGIETRDALDRLTPDPNGHGVARADLVIEAAPEKPDLKRAIYRDLGKRMKTGSILASNTSSLKLAELARSAKTPSRFAGLHFFNPVEKMQLVEVVAHPKTSGVTQERLAAFCGAIDRLPALVTDYPGFLVNRTLTPYLLEAMTLIEQGHDKRVIDAAAVDFGMPMGPIALADQVGLDICLDVADSMRKTLEKPLAEIPGWLRRKVEEGETGKKAGKGFYDWSDGPPKPDRDGGDVPPDLVDRLILPMLDACVECLSQGVAKDEDQVDAALIFAAGFAPFRGGPMRYARNRGPSEIRDRLKALAAEHGPRFAPDPGWSRLG